MSKYNYSEIERQTNNVLAYQDRELKAIKTLDKDVLEVRISESEDLLRSLGYELPQKTALKPVPQKRVMVVPSWENLCLEAEKSVGSNCALNLFFLQKSLRVIP